MAGFLISYDLRKPDYDYQPLYDALATIKAKHIQDSVWGCPNNVISRTGF